VLCADGRTRNYRAHGLRKAALYTLYKLGAGSAQLQSIGGHSSLAELQKYIQEVEQDEQMRACSSGPRPSAACFREFRNAEY
jgi:hypothetical protein